MVCKIERTSMTLEELLELAKAEGVNYIEYFDLEKDFEGTDFYAGVPDWHFDLYSENPYHYIRIPIPWKLSFGWKGWKNARGKWQWPVYNYSESWTFTYVKNTKVYGCQGVGGVPELSNADRLAHALQHYLCDKYSDTCPCHTDDPDKDYEVECCDRCEMPKRVRLE